MAKRATNSAVIDGMAREMAKRVVQKRAKTKVAPVQLDEPWGGITMGTVLRLATHRAYFLVASVDPTRPGSEYAWVVGSFVTSTGRRAKQIDHVHCPQGMRQELLRIDSVKVKVS